MNLGEKSLKNYEHITVSQDKEIIEQFSDNFLSMWANTNRFSDYTNDDDDEAAIETSPNPISVFGQRPALNANSRKVYPY